MYHANLSPRSLTTVSDPLSGYPARWELMRWYRCWRKTPYPSEVSAWITAQTRNEAAILALGQSTDYSHYPCPFNEPHWHVGRGGNKADPRHLSQRAKRTYRRAVRDEIWANHVEQQQQKESERA